MAAPGKIIAIRHPFHQPLRLTQAPIQKCQGPALIGGFVSRPYTQRAEVNHPKSFCTKTATRTGGTDARFYRQVGSVAYGAALFSPGIRAETFADRFHGNDERIDIESIGLSTELYLGAATRMLT